MAQKIKPNTFRIGITMPWANRWFFKKSQNYFLEEDHGIREKIKKEILQAGIASIEIERTGEAIRVCVIASRPGLIIGRGGKGIEELKTKIQRVINRTRVARRIPLNYTLNVNIEELKRADVSAQVIAQQIAFDIERRMPYRMLMRRQLEQLQQTRGVKGAKIKVAGRLNGAEISRRETLGFGSMPLQTLRANIDYGEATSFNAYGTIGVKTWIYKGEIFDERK